MTTRSMKELMLDAAVAHDQAEDAGYVGADWVTLTPADEAYLEAIVADARMGESDALDRGVGFSSDPGYQGADGIDDGGPIPWRSEDNGGFDPFDD